MCVNTSRRVCCVCVFACIHLLWSENPYTLEDSHCSIMWPEPRPHRSEQLLHTHTHRKHAQTCTQTHTYTHTRQMQKGNKIKTNRWWTWGDSLQISRMSETWFLIDTRKRRDAVRPFSERNWWQAIDHVTNPNLTVTWSDQAYRRPQGAHMYPKWGLCGPLRL